MEIQIWKALFTVIMQVGRTHSHKGKQFSDRWIALVFLWGVLHDRPRSWSCQEANWDQRCLDARLLPSRHTLGRRLRTVGVQLLLEQAQDYLRQHFPDGA